MNRKFDIHTNGKGKVVVTTYYGGRCFRGVAKCAPEDVYDGKVGVALATARCKQKLFKAKKMVATEKAEYYEMIAKRFEKLAEEARQYREDCITNIADVEAEIVRLIEDN